MRGIWIWVSTVESIKAAVARPAPELPPPASSAYRGTTESKSWKPKRAAKATRVSKITGRVSKTSRSVAPVVCARPFTLLTLPAKTASFPGGSVLDSPPWRVHDVDHASLYHHVPGWHDEVLVVPVLGPEPKEISFPVEPLDGDLLAAPDEGRYYGAIWRIFVFFYDQEVSVGYVRPDHGLPHNPQEVAPPARARPHELRRQRVSFIPHSHGLEPASGGDPTQQRHLTSSLPTFLRQPDAARPPTHPLDVPGLLQLFEMLVRGLGTPQAHGLPHLTHARRPLSPRIRKGQAPEHLDPYLPVLRDHPRLL